MIWDIMGYYFEQKIVSKKGTVPGCDQTSVAVPGCDQISVAVPGFSRGGDTNPKGSSARLSFWPILPTN